MNDKATTQSCEMKKVQNSLPKNLQFTKDKTECIQRLPVE